MTHFVEPTNTVVEWTVDAPKVRNVPPVLADPPPASDGQMFIPAAITVRYAHPGMGRLFQSPRVWACVEVQLHRRDGDTITTRTFAPGTFDGLPGWAEQFVNDNHPFARITR